MSLSVVGLQTRKHENLQRGYLQGRYGAVPFLGDWLGSRVGACAQTTAKPETSASAENRHASSAEAALGSMRRPGHEPEYLNQFKEWKRNPLVHVDIPDKHGVPRTLVEVAKERKSEAQTLAQRQRDENLSYDEVWCVFDVDNHPNIHEARDMARDNDIFLAVSNESFELWLLLHFQECAAPQNRANPQEDAKKTRQELRETRAVQAVQERLRDATQRATRLAEQAAQVGEPHRTQRQTFTC